MATVIYAFYNNKGGVGKTTLCQNAACLYAEANPFKQVLVIDLCPQANISQFLLGGAHVGYETNQKLQSASSRSNIVGFMDWLLKGNSSFTSIRRPYKLQVSRHNKNVTDNLFLIAGDSFLESLALALNYAVINPANVRAWQEYMTAISRLCKLEHNSEKYEDLTVFIDCNPSFSIYTQMGLVSANRLVVPMMADFSSLEGIKGILMLLYGEYPSSALKKYAEDFVTFHKKIGEFGLELPQFYEFAFNNFTAHLGVAKAYTSVKTELINFCFEQYKVRQDLFYPTQSPIITADQWEGTYVSDVKDFHTAGKVSASLGIPLHRLPAKQLYRMPDGEQVQVPLSGYQESLNHIRSFVARL